jgi:glycosyltransferase involved in cell wall biosynthesis
LLSKIFKCPFVFDIRDIWPESAVSAGQISPTGKAFRFGKVLERYLYDKADHLTCVSNAMAQYLKKMTFTPVTAVHNGVRPIDNLKQGQLSPQKTIMYAGNFGRVQGLEILIQGFSDLQETQQLEGWKVVLIGTGAHEAKLKSLIANLHLEKRVDVLPPITHDSVMQKMASAGILFMNLKPDKVFELTIPSKVFDYMFTGRPILAGILGEGKSILETTGANVCFNPSDLDSFKNALIDVVSNLPAFEKKALKNPELVLADFNRDNSGRLLTYIFSDLIETH